MVETVYQVKYYNYIGAYRSIPYEHFVSREARRVCLYMFSIVHLPRLYLTCFLEWLQVFCHCRWGWSSIFQCGQKEQ